MEQDREHYFTGHTNARLTFVVGVVMGISIVTLGGLLFFVYLFNGGQVGSYPIAPLDSSSQILTEPITMVDTAAAVAVSQPLDWQVYGAQNDYAVTLVQYVDYECQFCKKFYPDLLTFVDQHKDQVRFIVKQYPFVQIHPYAKTAAVAAYCAGQQQRLFEYSSRLFAAQSDLGSDQTYVTIGDTLHLDAAALAECRQQLATTAAIEHDATEALNLGVQSQPNLIIWHNDGTMQLIDGYVNTSYIASALSKELTAQ